MVMERHGVEAHEGYVDVREDTGCVSVVVYDGVGYRKAKVSSDAAEYLANKLFRLAQRAKERMGRAANLPPAQLGGRARAAKLTPARRSEIARNAAQARWAENKGN